jgi:hypothetical protein
LSDPARCGNSDAAVDLNSGDANRALTVSNLA